jgi:hypothetical protein
LMTRQTPNDTRVMVSAWQALSLAQFGIAHAFYGHLHLLHNSSPASPLWFTHPHTVSELTRTRFYNLPLKALLARVYRIKLNHIDRCDQLTKNHRYMHIHTRFHQSAHAGL